MRSYSIGLAASFAVAGALVAASGLAEEVDWRTPAEISSYRTTPTYDETLAYVRRVEAASPRRVKLTFFGESAEGRPLPLVIVDRDGKFTPEEVRKTPRATVLIQSGIHAGEIDGKDASLEILRELAVNHNLSAALVDTTILLALIYNPDGHERRSEFNRINQNGPKEMGFRTNALGLDLNRDYMKLDSPEARAFARLVTAWRPDLMIDCHVTDGADFRYDMTYAWQPKDAAPGPISNWMEAAFPRVVASLEARKHLTAPYIILKDEADPAKGMDGGVATPRFSTGYMPLRNRAAFLLEAHAYKDYATRVRATFDTLVALVAVAAQQRESLRRASFVTDVAKIEWGKAFDPGRKVVLRWKLEDRSEPFRFLGWQSTVVTSAATGGRFTIYTHQPKELTIPYFKFSVPDVEIVRPVGYLIPRSRPDLVERLELHGLRVDRTSADVRADFESYRLSDPKFRERSYQGRHPVTATATLARESRTFPKGSYFVPLAQIDADVAIHLLEPQGPDSFLAWGFFNTIFEQKEYYEPAVLERHALKMIEDEPLAQEFELAKAADPTLQKDAGAAREWFYRRSPYYDRELGLYPVARVTTESIPVEPRAAAVDTAPPGATKKGKERR